MRAIVRAIEFQQPVLRGYAERAAGIALRTGRAIGLYGRTLETLGYAALFYPIAAMLDSSESAAVIRGVDFLSEVVPILDMADAPANASSGDSHVLVNAYVVCASARRAALDRQHEDLAGRAGRVCADLRRVADERTSRVLDRVDRALSLFPGQAS